MDPLKFAPHRSRVNRRASRVPCYNSYRDRGRRFRGIDGSDFQKEILKCALNTRDLVLGRNRRGWRREGVVRGSGCVETG